MTRTHETTASWVIVSKATGRAVFETFSRRTADVINLDRYRVLPIGEWLGSLNAKERTPYGM